MKELEMYKNEEKARNFLFRKCQTLRRYIVMGSDISPNGIPSPSRMDSVRELLDKVQTLQNLEILVNTQHIITHGKTMDKNVKGEMSDDIHKKVFFNRNLSLYDILSEEG